MKQKSRKTLSLRFNVKIKKILTIDFKKMMIVNIINRKIKMTTA